VIICGRSLCVFFYHRRRQDFLWGRGRGALFPVQKKVVVLSTQFKTAKLTTPNLPPNNNSLKKSTSFSAWGYTYHLSLEIMPKKIFLALEVHVPPGYAHGSYCIECTVELCVCDAVVTAV